MPRDTIIDCTFCCPAVGTIERCDECDEAFTSHGKGRSL